MDENDIKRIYQGLPKPEPKPEPKPVDPLYAPRKFRPRVGMNEFELMVENIRRKPLGTRSVGEIRILCRYEYERKKELERLKSLG